MGGQVGTERSDAPEALLTGIANYSGDDTALLDELAQWIADAFDGLSAIWTIRGAFLTPVAAAVTVTKTPRQAAVLQLLQSAAPVRLNGDHRTARVARTGEPLTVAITDADLQLAFPREPDLDVARRLELQDALLVPLTARGTTIGCLSITRCGAKASALEPRDLERACALATRIAIALIDASTLASLERDIAARVAIEAHQRQLMQLAREFSATTDDHASLIDLVCRRFAEIVGEGCVIRFIEEGQLVSARSIYHPDVTVAEILRGHLTQPGSAGISGQVAKSGVPVRASEPTSEALALQIGPPAAAWIRELGICSVMSVPLRTTEGMMGVVTLWRTTPVPYTNDDIFVIESAATHAVLALKNARLIEETKRELAVRTRMEQRLKVLSEASRELAAKTSDLRELLAVACERFGKMFGDACVIRLVDEADPTVFERNGCIYHPDPAIIEYANEVFFATEQRAGEGISGKVLSSQKPNLVNATTELLAQHATAGFRELIHRIKLTSILAVPLLSGGRPIGAMTMCGTRHYTQEDVDFICELANHASLAIHNSRLIQEARRELAERRRTEESLRQTKEQFHQAQKMEAVGRLAGGIAHDFNNLLTVIVNASSVLLEDLTQPDSRMDVEDIQTAAHRAADLTRQLLAFSRQQVLEPQIIDLNAIVEKMRKIFGRVVGEDIAIAVVCAPEVSKIKADPGHINQVIMNLVVNARDAMPHGGTLTVETSDVLLAGIPHVMLAIRDTGMGMDEATQSRIFEPFFTTKDKSKGTGLGLSTVFGIVEQSGGSMRVVSRPGEGATFLVYFPRCDEVANAVCATEGRPLRGGETILLVEDDAQVRKVATSILQRSGYRVLTAVSGPDAITQYHQRLTEVDLLLSDVVMPEMSGRELADRLNTIRPDLRVLYMSGYTDDAIVHHRVLDPGIVLVSKPFTKASLLDRVRDVLTRS